MYTMPKSPIASGFLAFMYNLDSPRRWDYCEHDLLTIYR